MTAAPVSLYLDLEKGQVADLDVVAHAALAWSAAIKESAFFLDPSIDIRVELASGTEGSLSLNAIIKSVRDTLADKKTIRTIVLTSIFWTLEQAGAWGIGQILDLMKADDAAPIVRDLSEEDKQDIADRVVGQLNGRVAQHQVQRIYREAERDPAIKGVGVTGKPGKKPSVIVPREAFARHAGHAEIKEETITKRVVPQSIRVTLIRPVLVEDSTRRWRFRVDQREFSASMKDQAFLQRLLSGSSSVPMVTGIQMDLDLETTEEFRGGVWVETQRDVVRVVRLVPPQRQLTLPLPAIGDDQSGDTTKGDDDGNNDSKHGAK